MLTKTEACWELGLSLPTLDWRQPGPGVLGGGGLSLPTLDWRIAAGDLKAKGEPHVNRQRVYVVLDDEPPDNDGNDGFGDAGRALFRVAVLATGQ